MEPQTGELQHRFVEAGKDKMRSLAVISIAELTLIAALSGSGVYALINSEIYSGVRDFGETNNLLIIYYMPIILWGLLAVFGAFNITFRGKSSGSFVWLVALLSLPSLLSYNTVNWLGMLGLDFNKSPGLSFYEMLALGGLTITGYVVLSHMRIFKQLRYNLISREANPADIESVTVYSYLTLLLAIIAALAATMVVAFLSRNLELLVLDYIRDMPWNVVFIGLLCTLLLAVYLYWLGARRRPRS